MHALPVQIATFVGREHELTEIRSALDTSRLVTILGAGGSERRAVRCGLPKRSPPGHVCRSRSSSWPARDETLVTGAVAARAGVTLPATGDPLTALSKALATSQLRLVSTTANISWALVATLAAALVRDCPGVTILATSGSRWESAASARTAPSLNDAESTRLFVDRARAVNPQFRLGSMTERS